MGERSCPACELVDLVRQEQWGLVIEHASENAAER
jgi:hypothetical protein